MRLDRRGQRLQVVSAFQTTHEAAASVGPRCLQNQPCHLREVLDFQAERADRVGRVGVKARAQQD